MAEQEKREDSVLSYYKKLIALRKSDAYRETFTYGTFLPAYEEEEKVLAYLRVNEESGQKILVAANYGEDAVSLVPAGDVKKVMLSNVGKEMCLEREAASEQKITLGSCESAVILL